MKKTLNLKSVLDIIAGIIIGTGAALIHGIRKSGFLKKLNPVNWFKKK